MVTLQNIRDSGLIGIKKHTMMLQYEPFSNLSSTIQVEEANWHRSFSMHGNTFHDRLITGIAFFFMPWELPPLRRISSDLVFLCRTLPTSFNRTDSLFFSSSTVGLAVPSFSSLISTRYSNIPMASFNLHQN